MKRKKLFLLMIAFLLIGTSRVVGQEKSDAAPSCLLSFSVLMVFLLFIN